MAEDVSDEIYNLAYDELRRLARHYLRGDKAAMSLRPTELVNEAVSKLYGRIRFNDRKHLVATVSRAMRRVLVDSARERARTRRGENATRVTLHDEATVTNDRTVDILEIDTALVKLAENSDRVAGVAEMTIFGGLKQEEIADHFSVTVRSVGRDWAMARAWLARELGFHPTRDSDKDPE